MVATTLVLSCNFIGGLNYDNTSNYKAGWKSSSGNGHFLGLAVATVSGVAYSLDHYAPSYAALILGVISAVAGSLLRDVLCQVEPVLLHRETIGTACAVGALVYVLIEPYGLANGVIALISGAVIVLVRSISIARGWNLPKVK